MDQLAITFISATTALIAGIASPFVSISIARRQFKVSVISANRERSIEALRESIAEYIALATSVALIRRGSAGAHIEPDDHAAALALAAKHRCLGRARRA